MKHKYKVGDKFYIQCRDNKIHKCEILELYDLRYHNLYDDKNYSSYKVKIYGAIIVGDEFPMIETDTQIVAECMLFKHKSDAEYNWASEY